MLHDIKFSELWKIVGPTFNNYDSDDDNDNYSLIINTYPSFTDGGYETFRATNVLRPLQYTDKVLNMF